MHMFERMKRMSVHGVGSRANQGSWVGCKARLLRQRALSYAPCMAIISVPPVPLGRPYANPSMRLPADPETDVPCLARVAASLPDVRLPPAASADSGAPRRGPAAPWSPPLRVSAPAWGGSRDSGEPASTQTATAPWVSARTSALPWGRSAQDGGSQASMPTASGLWDPQGGSVTAEEAALLSASTRAASAPCLPKQRRSAEPGQQQPAKAARCAMAESSSSSGPKDSRASAPENGMGLDGGGSEDGNREGMSFPETLDGYVLQVPRH